MASVIPPKREIPPRKGIRAQLEQLYFYASRKIFIDAQLAERGAVPSLKYSDTLAPVMYADRDGFLQPMNWEGWTAETVFTVTQANVAGGAVSVEFSPGIGSEFELLDLRAVNSGTNGFNTGPANLNGNFYVLWTSVASGAGTATTVPQTGSGTTSATSVADSTPTEGRRISGTDEVRILQTGAGAQNDTLQVFIRVRLKHKLQLPSISFARSVNPLDVSVTVGTAAFVVNE